MIESSTRAATLWSRLIWSVLAVTASVNALYFSASAATPLLQADAWYFLEHFIYKYIDGSLGIFDFFIQRGSGDHAQPLQKLVLLWHTRYFGMDFRIEGIVGTLAAVGCCALIAFTLLREQSANASSRLIQAIIVGMVFVCGLSLNAINVYTWPLVTLGFIILFVALLFAVLVMGRTIGDRPVIIGFSALCVGMLCDEQSVIFAFSLIVGLALFGKGGVSSFFKMAMSISVGITVSRIVLWWISSKAHVSSSAFESGINTSKLLSWPDITNALIIPASDGLVHQEHLQDQQPWGNAAKWLLAAAGISLNVWIVWKLFVLRLRGQKDVRLVLAVFLLLICYVVTFGLVVNRVGTFGWDYLHQPRYVYFYQLPLLSLLVLLHFLQGEQLQATRVAFKRVPAVVLLFVIGLTQVVLSREAWKMPPYLMEYWRIAALKMEEIRVDPSADVTRCPDILEPCAYTPEHRIETMKYLHDHRLNLYSPSFQKREGLYPAKMQN